VKRSPRKKAAVVKAAKGALPVSPVRELEELISATVQKLPGVGRAEARRPAPVVPANAAADARVLTQLKRAVTALLDRKAEKLVVLNLQGLTSISDYFVFATATNERQAQALSDAVELGMKAEGRHSLSIEGYRTARWILLDYGDVIFHIFHEDARRFYGLERLWGDATDATSAFSG
jgi:ribosome-associated protein